MEGKKLVVSDLVDFPEERVKEIQQALAELRLHTATYVGMDDLYDLEGLERLKRNMVAQLELLSAHFSVTKKFKTMGDYLEETRKFLKSQAIQVVIAESKEKISINQAEKAVYACNYYIEGVSLMSKVKAFFIRVEVMYNFYQNTLSNVVQSISLCKKDNNYKYIKE